MRMLHFRFLIEISYVSYNPLKHPFLPPSIVCSISAYVYFSFRPRTGDETEQGWGEKNCSGDSIPYYPPPSPPFSSFLTLDRLNSFSRPILAPSRRRRKRSITWPSCRACAGQSRPTTPRPPDSERPPPQPERAPRSTANPPHLFPP